MPADASRAPVVVAVVIAAVGVVEPVVDSVLGISESRMRFVTFAVVVTWSCCSHDLKYVIIKLY
jgi:hypothetical protein